MSWKRVILRTNQPGLENTGSLRYTYSHLSKNFFQFRLPGTGIYFKHNVCMPLMYNQSDLNPCYTKFGRVSQRYKNSERTFLSSKKIPSSFRVRVRVPFPLQYTVHKRVEGVLAERTFKVKNCQLKY